MSEMTLREAQRDAWEMGEHECQRYGHCFPRSRETNEPLNCSGCGLDPDLYDPEAEEHEAWLQAVMEAGPPPEDIG